MSISLRPHLPALALLGALAGAAPAHAQLYYGGDGTAQSYATWINNPDNGLNQIVFDNFVVGAGQTWTVTGVYGNFAQGDFAPAPTALGWEIRSGMVAGGSVGAVVASGFGPAAIVGSEHSVATLPFNLGAGTYWIGMWADLANAITGGNAFFGVRTTGGANAVNAPGDAAAIWLIGADAANVGGDANPIPEDFSYGVRGQVVSAVPEPGTWALLGTGLLALGAVRRRRS